MSTDTILSVDGLKTQFFTESGVVQAVDGISFDVKKGEIVGLVGESGAGKSVASRSLIRLISSPGEIVAGEITYKGRTLFATEEGPDGPQPRDDMLSKEAIRREIRGNEIAMIFQDPNESLNPVFTVGSQLTEFIELNTEYSGSAAKERAVEVLHEVGIPEPEARFDEYPHQFSGGMRQRVLIAMAIACEPSLIIADEPTTALDVTIEGQIIELVKNLQEEYETSFIWVTHDMGVVAEICDRVNVMYLGEVVEHADVDDLFYQTKHPYSKALLESIPRPDKTTDSVEPIRGNMPSAINPPSGCRFHTRCPDAREVCVEIQPPEETFVGDSGVEQRASCLKHNDLGYDDSREITNDATVSSSMEGSE